MKAAFWVIVVSLLLYWALESCTGWTDAELEYCTGISVEESQQ
jgi:hypothetical protein